MFLLLRLKRYFTCRIIKARRKVLKTIVEAVKETYYEDNYNTRMSWLVEEILMSDSDFKDIISTTQDIEYLQKALAQSVENAVNNNK